MSETTRVLADLSRGDTEDVQQLNLTPTEHMC